jgi:membrane-associated phospholipid phosphatase
MEIFLSDMNNFLNKVFQEPLDRVIILYQVIVIGIILVHLEDIPNVGIVLGIHIGFILAIIGLRHWKDTSVSIFVKRWYPFVILGLSFGQLPHIIPYIYTQDIDHVLMQLDLSLFGVHPTVWFEQFHWPPFTEFLQIVYITFYFLPAIIMAKLLIQKDYVEFRKFRFVFFMGFFLSYIGYLLFPAIGPRFTLQQFQSFPLEGVLLTQWIQNTLNTLEQINRDAFPSGHTMMTVLCWIYAWKYSKKLAYVYTFITIFMITATIYLRYHYVVDVIGGIIFVGLTFLIYWPFRSRLNALFERQNLTY